MNETGDGKNIRVGEVKARVVRYTSHSENTSSRIGEGGTTERKILSM